MTDQHRTTCATCGEEVEDWSDPSVAGPHTPHWVHVGGSYEPCYPRWEGGPETQPPVTPAELRELVTLREHVHWLAGEHGRARAARDRYRAAWRSARGRAAAANEEAARQYRDCRDAEARLAEVQVTLESTVAAAGLIRRERDRLATDAVGPRTEREEPREPRELRRLQQLLGDVDGVVQVLRELHQPVGGCCGVCADEDGQAARWPCPTARALGAVAARLTGVAAERPAVPELVGVGEAAVLLGVSRQRAGQLINKRGFPRPVAELGCGSIFIADEVRRFAEARDRSPGRRKGPQPRRRPRGGQPDGPTGNPGG